MAGVLLVGAVAVFLAGLGAGILLASNMMHHAGRRSRLIGWVRGLRGLKAPAAQTAWPGAG